MKAVQITKYGTHEVLEITQNTPSPTPNKNQILVEMFAASINPYDVKLVSGMFKEMMPLTFPFTPGGDFAGVVKELGKDVTDVSVGDEVFGQGSSGSFAEMVVANTTNIAKKPKSVNFNKAAALPLVGACAIQALEEHITLKKGQKLLIHGGAGGIGHVAIQLAKGLGAYVATTVSMDDRDFAKSLGADEIIDYKTQKFETLLKNFDAVFDTVGGETTTKSFAVLRQGGILVSMLGKPNVERAKEKNITVIGQNTNTNTRHLTRLAELVDTGKIKVHVDKEFFLEEIQKAFKYQQDAHPRGKVVITIKEK